jgi:hypothetical protein
MEKDLSEYIRRDDLFDYLQNNLIVKVEFGGTVYAGERYDQVKVKLLMRNPRTGNQEVISESSEMA